MLVSIFEDGCSALYFFGSQVYYLRDLGSLVAFPLALRETVCWLSLLPLLGSSVGVGVVVVVDDDDNVFLFWFTTLDALPRRRGVGRYLVGCSSSSSSSSSSSCF